MAHLLTNIVQKFTLKLVNIKYNLVLEQFSVFHNTKFEFNNNYNFVHTSPEKYKSQLY